MNSAALIADAVHSLSDVFSDIVVLLGVRLSSRPPDKTHAYGHGRYETMAASVIGVMLIGAGLFFIWDASYSLYRGEVNIPGYPVIIVALISILAKEGIYQVTQRVARRTKSSVLCINAWHHRSDALSSVAVLIGAITGLFGWGHGDQSATIAVGILIIIVGINALRNTFTELSEASIPTDEQDVIVEAIQSVPGVRSWHYLRTRLVGREIFMDVHVQVDARLSVAEGHAICHAVENAIVGATDRSINIVVHCEPESDSPETN